MLEYWYLFMITGIVLLIGVLFLIAIKPVLQTLRFGVRFAYNFGMALIILGFIALIGAIVVEVWKGG